MTRDARYDASPAAAVVAGLMLALNAGGVAQGQQDASFSQFQLNRSLPGARSLAMGGSFVAVADDASAAYANPAGLTLLTRREVSAEGRAWENKFTFTDRGRIEGSPSGRGIDTIPGLVRRDGESRTSAVSFASYVDAVKDRRWIAALYYRTYADFSAQFFSQGVFSDKRFGPYRFKTIFDVNSVGGAFAYQFGDCELYKSCVRVGAALNRFSLHLDALEDVFHDPPNDGPATFHEPLDARARHQGDDAAYAVTAGVLYELGPTVRLAIAYRQGPSFSISENVFGMKSTGRLRLPAEYSAGFSWRCRHDLRLALEVDRVTYSSFIAGNSLERLHLADGTELRLGGEWVLRETSFNNKLIAMAGAWYDPDHSLASKGPIVIEGDLFRRAYFPEGSAQAHFSAGFGVHWRSVQANIAGDVSRQTRTGALSAIYRF
jgi:long-chain fatty acid transport protein